MWYAITKYRKQQRLGGIPMKQLSLLAKIMFCIVAILFVVTVVLGVITAVKDSKEDKDKNQNITSTTLTPGPTSPGTNSSETPGSELENTPTAAPTKAPAATGGHKIAIDPGQQQSQMTEEEEKVEAVIVSIFLVSKITVDNDCSHEIRRDLLLGRKAMTNLDSV